MKTSRQLKKLVKKKYPNAVNIKLGSNGIINGVWFDKGLDSKVRTFISAV